MDTKPHGNRGEFLQPLLAFVLVGLTVCEKRSSMKLNRLLAVMILAICLVVSPHWARAAMKTIGPGGEPPTPSRQVVVSDDQADRLKKGGYTAALLWHTAADFTDAVTAGAAAEFKRLGITITAVKNAEFDPARQRRDIEKLLAKNKPDIILALPLDPVVSAMAFKQAIKKKVKLVFLSNVPKGYRHGRDYASIVTDDLFMMGKQAADALARSLGGKGKVGWIYHNAAYYVTNQRDNAFKTTIETQYPGMKIVAEQGISDIGRAEEIAKAMFLATPDIDGIYVTWSTPAEAVLAVLRANDNRAVKLVTLDLCEPLALDMVRGGNVAALVADEAYELGRAMAAAGALSLLGQKTPAFITAPAVTITKENAKEGWVRSLNKKAPQSILKAVDAE